jgi:hypothetical protein
MVGGIVHYVDAEVGGRVAESLTAKDAKKSREGRKEVPQRRITKVGREGELALLRELCGVPLATFCG